MIVRTGRRHVDRVGEEVVEHLLDATRSRERRNVALELEPQPDVALLGERRPGGDPLLDDAGRARSLDR